MGNLKPKESILKEEDVKFFYKNVLSRLSQNISGYNSICSVSKKFGFKVIFVPSQSNCNIHKLPYDKIIIYDKSVNANEQFLRHIRNAFAHLLIDIDDNGGRCKLIDWDKYLSKNHKYSRNTITMQGDVNYESLKNAIQFLFSDQNKK